MRLKNYFILLALIFTVSFLLTGKGYSARLSEGNEITSPPQKTDNPDNNMKTKVTPQNDVSSQKTGKEDSRLVQVDFDNADIIHLINFISKLTGKNFIVDPGVKGKANIISPTKVTVDEAYKTFESVLEVNGLTTVPSGKSIKIVPFRDARSKDIETRFGGDKINPEDRVITQIIPLKYASPSELKKVLSGYGSKDGLMIAYDQTGVLIVTDVQSNIASLLNIINKIDIPGTGEEINVIPLKLASAKTMATLLKTVFKAGSGAGNKPNVSNSQIIIEPDERTNSLIVVASEVDTLEIKSLINLLDKNRPKGEGAIRVYNLQNADAEELASTLNAIPKETGQGSQQGGAGAVPVISRDTQIVPDKATNALIITAQKDEYEILEDVIKKLDSPRSMVYIQSLTMEVSLTKDLEIGVQWQVGDQGSSVSQYAVSNPGVNNFPSVSTSGVTFPTGLTYGVLGNTITIGGVEFADLGAVFRAYATDSDVQIYSNPEIMTLDNEEAELSVTDNVPYITRQDETNSGIAYSNYDFKDVGVQLNITPQINNERFVRLKIDQTISQILSTNEQGQPTTFERKAKTTVRIKDGQTIVIGGLINTKDNRTNYKVPFLGRIPILGWLFRSSTKATDNKNLYIFITPHIVENVEEANTISQDKKGHFETIKEGVIRMHNNGELPEDMRRVELGYRNLQLKDYEKALKYFDKALEINPNNPYAILNKGYVYQMQGEKRKAMDMYEKLIAMDPPDRAAESTDEFQLGRKLTDIAKNNIKSIKADE
jgi:general secretion pathway protein D